MKGSAIIFYLLSAIALVSAILSVTTRKIFRAAIFLLFSLVAVAGIYFWMEYEFIAAVQIVIYVGGITVLIIFSIFLTQQAGELLPAQNKSRFVFSGLAALLGFLMVLTLLLKHTFSGTSAVPLPPTVENVGRQMLSVNEGGYALPFEVVSVLLLAAMVGCIVIAMRSKSDPT